MLKRKIWIFASFCLIFSEITVFAQENSVTPAEEVVVEEPVRYQFVQQFKWKKTDKAAKYEVLIESLENGKWEQEMPPVVTKETSLALSLYPGKKRISITSLNKLGRRGQTTPWTEFIVLDETQPYLYDDYLKKSKQWNSPLLQVTLGSGEEKVESLSSENGDPENSFFLKGKNIFLTDTKFYMEPAEESSSGGEYFVSFNKLRKTVPLKLVRRDFDKPGVVVEYNPEELYSGYYKVFAENPGNQKTSLDILVMANREPVINQEQFEYYPNYDVRLLDTDKIRKNDNVLKVTGSGFTGDTRFTITPSSAGLPYPYATAKDRIKSELNVMEINPLSEKGDMELSFKLSPGDVPPGYYNFTAENSMGKTTVFLLVRNVDRESLEPEIDGVSIGKGDSKEKISFELKGQNLTDECVYTLISQMSKYTGQSVRIPLNISEAKKNGGKIVLQSNKEKVTPGVYAVLAETPEHSAVKFIEVNEKIKGKIIDLSLQEEEELFIRPVNFVAEIYEEGQEVEEAVAELVYTPTDFVNKKRFKVLFPYLELDIKSAGTPWSVEANGAESSFPVGFTLGLLNLHVFHLGLSGTYDYVANRYSTEAFIRLSPASQNFRPYIGFGLGVNVFDINYCCPADLAIGQIRNVITGTDPAFTPHGIYAFANLGVCLFNFIDVRYSVSLSGADKIIGYNVFSGDHYFTGKYFYDDITIGARLPLGGYKHVQKPKYQILTVTKNGPVSGKDYKLRKDIKKIVFANGITEISEFNDNYKLTSISIPDTVKVIGKDAFKNCYNLKEVTLPDGVEEICDGAFEGCRSMQKISIPSSIRKISPTAFSDWKDFQYIVYEWSKDDTTVRDLGGLANKPNFTTVYDARRTPFEKRDIFTTFSTNKNVITSVSNQKFTEDGIPYIGVEYRAKFVWSNNIYTCFTTSDPMAMRYLQNGDGITFRYKGDGHKYRIIISSVDQKTHFQYDFYAKKGDGSVTIPYKFFEYGQYYSQRFVSLRKMDIGEFKIEPDFENIYNGKEFKLTIYGIETIMEKKKK